MWQPHPLILNNIRKYTYIFVYLRYKTNKMSKKIINFREVSRVLTGKEDTIRSTHVPVKYKEKVDQLEKSVNRWVKNCEIYKESRRIN